MKTLTLRVLFVAVMAVLPQILWTKPTPVDLAPITHNEANLQVIAANGRVTNYTPEMLETLPTYRVVTTTPWRSEPTVFEGVLLSDLLQKHNLDRAGSIRITAEDEFVSVMEADVSASHGFILATRVNGKPHERGERGPIQIILDADAYNASDSVREGHLVWFVSKIEAVE